MRRLYSTFPGGLPGVGLLFLRAAIGARFILHALKWIIDPQSMSMGTWALGLLALVTGAAFMLGFLTPIVGALSAVAGIAVQFWPTLEPSIISLLNFDAIIVALAISLLGPGAFSLDAHFFGRRKIVIPRVASS